MVELPAGYEEVDTVELLVAPVGPAVVVLAAGYVVGETTWECV